MRVRSPLSYNRRELAVEYFEQGYGEEPTASSLRVPTSRVRKLHMIVANSWQIMSCREINKTMYSFDLKKEILERFLVGESKPALAKEFQLSSPRLLTRPVLLVALAAALRG